MKKTLRLMAFALMGAAMFGFAACGDDDNNNKTNNEPYYSLTYQGQTLADGDTVEYTAQREALSEIAFYVNNLTSEPLTSRQYIAQLEGSYEYEVCYGGVCTSNQDNDFTIPVEFDNVNSEISLHVTTSTAEGPALFKLTVGQGAEKAHGVTAYLKYVR